MNQPAPLPKSEKPTVQTIGTNPKASHTEMADPETRAVLIRARTLLKATQNLFATLPESKNARHLEGRHAEVIADIDRLVPRVRGERENHSPMEANGD